MARTRCGDCASSSLKLKLPLASALVRPDSCMPWVRLRRMTSSPAAGLLVVEFVRVPVRVWAAAREGRKIVKAMAPSHCLRLSFLSRPIYRPANNRSFDCVEISLREVSTSLRMTAIFWMAFGEDRSFDPFMIWVFWARRRRIFLRHALRYALRRVLPGEQLRPGARRLRLRAMTSSRDSRCRGFCRRGIRSCGRADFRRLRLYARAGKRLAFFRGRDEVCREDRKHKRVRRR